MHDPRNACQGLSADEDDAPQVRRRAPTHGFQFQRNALVVLALTCAVGYGMFYYNRPASPIISQPQVAGSPRTPAQNIASLPEPSARNERRPQALADCIGPDNLINEAVATCRFGRFPDAVHNPAAQGMVSAQYMQQYKTSREHTRQRPKEVQSLESALVWQWDRKRTFYAQWLVADGRIDGSSVCRNWRAGSIEYRECRKGAKVHFKEQCRNPRLATAAHRQFCSAGDAFNPM